MEPVKQILLKRSGLFFPPRAEGDKPSPSHLVDALETWLAGLGYVMTGRLRAALQALSTQRLEAAGKLLLKTLSGSLGARDDHEPLFRRFPRGVPKDTWKLYVERVAVHFFQEPDQPCLLCDDPTEIHALSPCGHLVCGKCFDGSNYSACPICNRKISKDTPFLKPPPENTVDPDALRVPRFRRLDLGTAFQAAARELFVSFLERTTPLSPQDTDDLTTLLDNTYQEAASWLPDRIPVKEIMALVIGRLLTKQIDRRQTEQMIRRHLKTATDVLRVICAYSDAVPTLLEKPKRFRSMPRWLRRSFLGVLDSCRFENLAEDLRRHPGLWKRAAEPLHPFEDHARHAKASLAFAILRRTRISRESSLGEALAAVAAAQEDRVELKDGRFVFRSWSSDLERALDARDWPTALHLVEQRPGELSRRLDHLLRMAAKLGEGSVADLARVFAQKTARMATPILMTLGSHLRSRASHASKRVFFPRGEVLLSWATKDDRALLPSKLTSPFVDAIDEELLQRASRLEPVAAALIDAELAQLIVPFNERTASRALVAVPRGSALPLPGGENARLFLHWMDPPGVRVDLDLSVSFYDEQWKHIGKCDYTNLRLQEGIAIHSGDFTSAPGPQGASEFVDLKLEALRSAGARYAIMVVFSYNNVPFEMLPRGFAGYMSAAGELPTVFDAPGVKQRFDLQGRSRVCAPMLVDLAERRMLWMDVNMTVGEGFHSVDRHSQGIGHIGSDFVEYFQGGSRPTMWHLACVHGAARARRAVIRDGRGELFAYERGPKEPLRAYYRRLVERGTPDHVGPVVTAGQDPWFVCALEADRDVPEGSEVYALRGDRLEASRIVLISAGDLVAQIRGDAPTVAPRRPDEVGEARTDAT